MTNDIVTTGLRKHADTTLAICSGIVRTLLMAALVAGILVALALGMRQITSYGDRVAETGSNMFYVKAAMRTCPAMSTRGEGLLADGRVTADERDIMRLLVDNGHAAHGAAATCRQPVMGPDYMGTTKGLIAR